MPDNPTTPRPTPKRDGNLKRIAHELFFIRQLAQNDIEGNFEQVDEICLSVSSALEALDAYEVSLQPETEEPVAA